ncbi:MAG: transcription elongation factor GreA [Patescibacteria group bacterium]
MKQVQITKEGLENLHKERAELIEVKRPTVIDRLQKARAMGDLSENSEYTSAKEELAFTEERIKEIEAIVKHAEVAEAMHSKSLIALGSKVTVEKEGHSDHFTIVGEFEADPVEKKLSYNSPIGKALIGKKVGEVIDVQVPAGNMTYKILSIN